MGQQVAHDGMEVTLKVKHYLSSASSLLPPLLLCYSFLLHLPLLLLFSLPFSFYLPFSLLLH